MNGMGELENAISIKARCMECEPKVVVYEPESIEEEVWEET
jgi:hypothetical protein